MNVVAGKLKGSKIIPPSNNLIRPTSDKVKEAVFNILQAEIAGSSFLDLFSGSGNIGIEAVSRGASEVFFVESSHQSHKLTIKNIERLGIDNACVVYKDAIKAIKYLHDMGKSFDIIYIDPPFNTDLDVRALKAIAEFDILCENGTIIIEHKRKKELQNIENCFIIDSVRNYGTVSITILRKSL